MTKNAYFFCGLKLSSLRILVVGCGKVGMRKIKKLHKYSSHITVIDPHCQNKIKKWLGRHKIILIEDTYKSKYLKKKNLVVITTNDPIINEKIYSDSKKLNILVNHACAKDKTDIVFPLSFKIGNLAIFLSTGGLNFSLLKAIKNRVHYVANYRN